MSLVFEVSSNALVRDVLSPLIRVSRYPAYYSRYPARSLLFKVSSSVLIIQGIH